MSDARTAEIYGDLWAELARNGEMIPTNDIWIAAAAIQNGIPLVSNDEHLERIVGLEVERW